MNSDQEMCLCSSRLSSSSVAASAEIQLPCRPQKVTTTKTSKTLSQQKAQLPRPQLSRLIGKAKPNVLCIAILIVIVIYLAVTTISVAEEIQQLNSKSSKVQFQANQQQQNNSTTTLTNAEQSANVKLDCKPGEQRHFSYESSTRVWGSSHQQQVRLRASLKLRCLEAHSNGTLKYLVEILALTPNFESAGKSSSAGEQQTGALRAAQLRAKLQALNGGPIDWRQTDAAHAEPVFEEVAEAIGVTATRVKRSVSGWFSKTWSSVKDFFGNIFTSSEKSSVSREQAFRESGLDIAGQCKSSGGKTSSGRLPIDESVFDDLEPKYYIGASLDSLSPVAGGSTIHYDFDERDDEVGDQEDVNLSFFDDPPTPAKRNKRFATGTSSTGGVKSSGKGLDGLAHERLIKLPFVLLQSPLGRIIDVRFASEDTDISVKNFKRHLCDLFATNLERSRNQLNEVSPIGQHSTKYLLDGSANSEQIRQTLVKAAASSSATNSSPGRDGSSSSSSVEEQTAASRPLVRVLAMMASQQQLERDMSTGNNYDDNGNSTGSNQPNSTQVNQQQIGGQGDATASVSVLRTVNSTNNIQLNSRTFTPDIERMQVQVRQVQHISAGRLTGTAGQLSMSLLQSAASGRGQRRVRRSVDAKESASTDDMADLLQVSTSFSVQLVPANRLPLAVGTQRRFSRSTKANDELEEKANKTTTKVPKARVSLVSKPPSDQVELEQVLREWRQLEQKLQLSSAGVQAESGGRQEAQQQRLEVLRDQIQMRLNEESMRNRLRRSASFNKRTGEGAGADATGRSTGANDLGLGLSQLVLDSGVTSRRKGSIYLTIEEALELESSLEEDRRDGSMAHLLRKTARVDKLRQHCRSAVATLDEIRTQKQRLTLKSPFNLPTNAVETDADGESGTGSVPIAASWSVAKLTDRNRKRLDQCQQVLRVLLRASERQAADLTLELVDECNRRLLAGSRDEELGWGPTSRYYRSLRQQFIELLALINRPNEQVLDKLLARLHHPKLQSDKSKQDSKQTASSQQEFTYVNQDQISSGQRYNRSLLREEDDYNNNESEASLLMIITTLASRPSINRSKRNEIADKLVSSLLTKPTTTTASCSVFSAPDLDILEAMGNFQEPLDEAVNTRIIQIARRCRHQDQYLVGSVHALSGQVRSGGVQKFFNELLRATNTSCTVKSEIVLTLLSVMSADELKLSSTATSTTNQWPSTGTLNQLDETLLELTNERDSKRSADRKCLNLLVGQYMSKKQQYQRAAAVSATASSPDQSSSTSATRAAATGRRGSRSRNKREVANENNFWDEAHCRRWQLGDGANPTAANHSPTVIGSDLVDELDDNSILQAIAHSRNNNNNSTNSLSASRGRNLKLLERELEMSNASGLNGTNGIANEIPLIRKRHKCSASKTYGPKNAQATLRTDIVNDLIGAHDENKFLARFRLATNFLGNRIDVGRMYLWHQKRITRAHVNILGKSLWDTSHSCQDKAPQHFVYMPLFDFNLWLVKVSVGLRLQSEMGFFSNCAQDSSSSTTRDDGLISSPGAGDQLELFPSVALRASGEASAKFVVARAGMSLASQYGYQGNIRVSRQPESCMSISSGHQPMNVTFSSWYQLFDNDCHYWASRNRAEPQAIKWRLTAQKPIKWLQDECLGASGTGSGGATSGIPQTPSSSRSLQNITP